MAGAVGESKHIDAGALLLLFGAAILGGGAVFLSENKNAGR
jgi:hypothetical protein